MSEPLMQARSSDDAGEWTRSVGTGRCHRVQITGGVTARDHLPGLEVHLGGRNEVYQENESCVQPR